MIQTDLLQWAYQQPDKGRAWLLQHLETVEPNTFIGLVVSDNTQDTDLLLNTLHNAAIANEDLLARSIGPQAVAVLLNLP
jgi:hypothetical protein